MKAAFTLAAVVVVLMAVVLSADAACDVSQLAPCASAITSGAPPSKQCCASLRAQKPCLCGYLKNPSLKQYVSSPNAKKVASSCGVAIPKC